MILPDEFLTHDGNSALTAFHIQITARLGWKGILHHSPWPVSLHNCQTAAGRLRAGTAWEQNCALNVNGTQLAGSNFYYVCETCVEGGGSCEFDRARLCAQLKKPDLPYWFLSDVVLVLVKFASVLWSVIDGEGALVLQLRGGFIIISSIIQTLNSFLVLLLRILHCIYLQELFQTLFLDLDRWFCLSKSFPVPLLVWCRELEIRGNYSISFKGPIRCCLTI